MASPALLAGEAAELQPKCVPTHMVDVQQLEQVRRDHPDLHVSHPCCGDGAAACLVSGPLCCLALFALGPGAYAAMLLGAASPEQWLVAVIGVSCVLFCLGFLACCRFSLPIGMTALSPPPPAACKSPLVEKAANATHRASAVHRVAVVYNPHSGKGMALRLVQGTICPALRGRGVDVTEIPTQRVNHGREIGFGLDLAGLDGIVAVGGDGTFHEVANGLLKRGSECSALPPLGIVPMGSGNAVAADFRQNQSRQGREISVYEDLDATLNWAVERVLGGQSCCVDTLEVNTCGQSVHAAAFVFVGMVAETDVLSEPFRWMGPSRFDVVGLWQALKRQPMAPCRITVTKPDGSTQLLTSVPQDGGSPWLALSIGLLQHWSDTMRSSPMSRLDDGVGELHIITGDSTRQDLVRSLLLLPTGAHYTLPHVLETHVFTELAIAFQGPERTSPAQQGIINVDGEVFRHDGSVHIKLLPRHLRVFCDPGSECSPATDLV